MTVNLGDEVKDMVTGFKGIAVCRHSYLQGCDRITVQPKVKKGEIDVPNEQSFDEPQLVIIKTNVIKRKATKDNPGGPEKHKPSRKSTASRR